MRAFRLANTDWERLVGVVAFVALLSAGYFYNLTFVPARSDRPGHPPGGNEWIECLDGDVTGEPASTVANTIVFSLFAAIALGMAAVVYAPLIRSDV